MSELPTLTEDDVALAFAADINPILIEAFLEEAPMHASRFGEAMMHLDRGNGSLDDVAQAQRLIRLLWSE